MNQKISIVTSLYNSEAHILEFYNRCNKEITTHFDDYEFVFVNDGSKDTSISIVETLSEQDQKVKVIDFSKNFGHHKALMTGLKHATGDLVFMLDVDLEEDPSVFNEYLEAYKSEDNIEHVYGSQKHRKGGLFEKISGYFFYKLFNWLSNVKIEPNIITARLMSKRFVKSLMNFEENEIFIAGLCLLNGYPTKHIKVNKTATSPSNYSLKKRFELLVNGVTSFSTKPLYLIFLLGCFLIIGSIIFSGVIVFLKLSSNTVVNGWTSLIIVTLLMSGLILFSLGIVSIYLSKVFIESKNRPYVIVKRIINE